MICLDNTDTLEGGASVTNVVDYTVHGLVGTTFTNIAQGQLSDTNPSVLYTAGAAISIVSVIYVNTHSAAVTVDLYLDPANAATPRRLIPKTLSLGIGYSMHFDGARCSVMDASGNLQYTVTLADVPHGGTGLATITDHGIMVGSGVGAVTPLPVGAATELLVGAAGADPVWTTATGSGAPVRATSPALVTPALGTPSAGNLGNCTGYPSEIKGDGTAGRVLRLIYIYIDNGTNATTIKPQSVSTWNGDTNASEDNLGKSGDTGDFALDASGSILSLQASGITGDLIAVLAGVLISNLSGTALVVNSVASAGSMNLTFINATTGATVDLTTLVDTGIILVRIAYVTSA